MKKNVFVRLGWVLIGLAILMLANSLKGGKHK